MTNEYIEKGEFYDALWDAKEEKKVKSLKDVFAFLDKFPAEDGVVVPPCKVGDTVYSIFEGEIRELKVISYSVLISHTTKHSNIHTTNSRGAALYYEQCDVGENVFLTKEQAEQKLKEMRDVNDR